MKKYIVKLSVALALMVTMGACTSDFDEVNTHPYQISDESLQQDFNHIGAYYSSLLTYIFGDQIHHNLVNDSYARHLATPTPFVGGVNNTTYDITWNVHWNRVYNKVMAPSWQVIELAEEGGYSEFAAWANLIQIMSTSRLTAYHGPIIYTNYGSASATVLYDTEETLYTTWFSELDDIVAALSANPEYAGLANFDATYGGDVTQWIKFANSMRLRLAIRLSNVAPDLAKTEGEKAINNEYGVILDNADNMNISLYGGRIPINYICFDWGDTRMSATMESILVGYEDGRISKFFEPATDDSLYPDHPNYPYKGIRNGAELVAKGDRLSYSTISLDFKTITERKFLCAAEVQFLLAEAALRGWSTPNSAEYHYTAGVHASFSDWGASGVDAYLANDTNTPLDYDDPKAEGAVNDFVNRINVTVKWDEAADNETKLEKIITQKWIAGFTNSMEAWVDHRRTGYPKLPYNYKNDSNESWGVIAKDADGNTIDFLRRMPFMTSERNNNSEGVADATTKLGGPDMINTRLWWDTGLPNF